jgi:hypothetical protein
MYMCVCPCVSCSIVMLFTRTLVRRRQTAMKGLSRKPDPLGQTARYWMGRSKQEIHLERETSRKLSLSLDRGQKGRIHEVLQEDGCSNMYKL